MASYPGSNPGGGDSDASMYEDSAGQSGEPQGDDQAKAPEDSTEQTGLLPKSFFAGKDIKPGLKYQVEIVKVYEDEAECRLSNETPGDEKGEGPMKMGAPQDSEMAGMMQ